MCVELLGVVHSYPDALVSPAFALRLQNLEAADLAGRVHVSTAVGLLVEPYYVDDPDFRNYGWNEIHLVPGRHLIVLASGPTFVAEYLMTQRRSAVVAWDDR
jgi:hypothetical protein